MEKFSNKIERMFLECGLSSELEDKLESILKIIDVDSFNKEVYGKEINVNVDINNSGLIEDFLNRMGVMYFLSTTCSSPFKLRSFLNILETELIKVNFKKWCEDAEYNGEKIIIIENKEMDSLGKYTNGVILINSDLINKSVEKREEVILHEIVHLVLFKSGLQKIVKDLFGNFKIDELLADVISKNWFSIFSETKFEHPRKRIEDFNLISNFIKENTTINENMKILELGAGEGVFSIIAESHGCECEGIDIDENLDSVKHGYVKLCNVKDFVIKDKINVIHSNMFMYMETEEIKDFIKKNIKLFDCLFVTYNTERKDNFFDKKRISFCNEEFFKEVSIENNLEYFELIENKKRILCKKEVLKYGS